MRFSLAVIAIAASSATATLVARQLPACANDCLFGDGVDLDGCSPTNNECLCKSKPFISKATECIAGACTGQDLQAALGAAQQLCAAVGVTLSGTVPAPTDSASGSGSGSSTPSSTSTTSAPSTTPTAPTTTRSSTSAPASNTSSATSAGTAPPAQSTAPNSAFTNTIPANAFAGIAAIGLVALAL